MLIYTYFSTSFHATEVQITTAALVLFPYLRMKWRLVVDTIKDTIWYRHPSLFAALVFTVLTLGGGLKLLSILNLHCYGICGSQFLKNRTPYQEHEGKLYILFEIVIKEVSNFFGISSPLFSQDANFTWLSVVVNVSEKSKLFVGKTASGKTGEKALIQIIRDN